MIASAVKKASGSVIRRIAPAALSISNFFFNRLESMQYRPTVIKCTLEPLLRIGVRSVLVEIRKMTPKSSDTFASHWIALVRHS